ncbi:MAG: hypothetical protein ACKO7N_07030, partial [Candidatus Nitrosotenuis sp.]
RENREAVLVLEILPGSSRFGQISDLARFLTYMYILSNNKPLIKISQFEVNQNEIGYSNYGIKSAWNVSFLSGYLENNCNNITMIGFKENTKIIIDDVIMLCKN